MFKISYISPDGREWEFDHETSPVFVVSEGVEGFVGGGEDIALTADGLSGQMFAGVNVFPIEGALSGYCRGESVSDFRAGFSRRRCGTLVVDSPVWGRLELEVRVVGGGVSVPHSLPDDRWVSFSVSLVSDRGVWFTSPLYGSDNVTVTNSGDVNIWPEIRWQGAGGVVTLPSGATFTLPNSTARRVLTLDPMRGCMVSLEGGAIDRAMWKTLTGSVNAEGVPVGETRTYRVPAGAELVWRVGVFDPWGGLRD